MKYLLVLMVMNMAAAAKGMTLQNKTAEAFPLFGELRERQQPSQDAQNKIHPRSKRAVGAAFLAAASLSSASLGSGASAGAVSGAAAGGLSAALASAGLGAASTIAGGILANSIHMAYSRSFEMRVENLMKWPLQNAKYSTWWGDISSPPHSIRPCEIGGLAGHKHSGTATGTHGIVDWKIKELDMTIILFWSVPYDHSLCNSLGLGIYKGLDSTEPSYENRYQYFYDMYYYHENFDSSHHDADKTIKTFYACNHARKICTNNGNIVVCGIMSTNSNANFDIQVGEVADPLYCAGEETDDRKPGSRGG